MLQWARERGCPWDATTCAAAAKGGHLEILKWARKHNCPWNESTTSYAIVYGHVGLLTWAQEHGCPQEAAYDPTAYDSRSDTSGGWDDPHMQVCSCRGCRRGFMCVRC